MATKPKEVPCDEVNDCSDELRGWLVSRNLAGPKVSALKASFDVLATYRDESRLENVVACCLYEVEMFLAAAHRRDAEVKTRRLERLSDADRSLLYDDGPEVETDKAIRAFDPKLAHLQRLIRRVATRKVQRAKLKGFNAEVTDDTAIETEFLESRAIEQIESIRRKLTFVLEAFQIMCPALPEDEVTLSGWRKLERSVRKRLQAVGYEPTVPEPARPAQARSKSRT
ncbi:MAG TPA: hypothetical protein VJV79_31400 [Polyangiaceae bacterium]|nr:hypothetical protein [Polyangiaceae bacterium]